MRQKILGLKVPTNDTIKSRKSTVAKSLATSVVPRIDPSDWELEIAKKILRFDQNGPLCTYCGKRATELDHLNPLIDEKEPSGYITEIANLVPCCHKCNRSKGSKQWKEWLSDRKDITEETKQESIRILTRYTTELPATKLKFHTIKGFKSFWDNYYNICEMLEKAEAEARELLPLVDNTIYRHLSPERRIVKCNNKFNIFSVDGREKILKKKNADNIEILKSTNEADSGAEYVSDEIFLLQFGKKYGVLTLDGVIVWEKYDKIEIRNDYLCGIKSGKEYYVTPEKEFIEYDQDPPTDAIRFIDRYDYDPSLEY